MRLEMPLEEAEALHAALEELLEGERADERVAHLYRLLGWRILASRQRGSGLTGHLIELARRADSLEDYEAARDRELGPLLEVLENVEQRDA